MICEDKFNYFNLYRSFGFKVGNHVKTYYHFA